jgi:hypothetical protein
MPDKFSIKLSASLHKNSCTFWPPLEREQHPVEVEQSALEVRNAGLIGESICTPLQNR